MNPNSRKALAILTASLQLFPALAAAATTDLTTLPIATQAQAAQPNVIFGIDDSSSMDSEVMLPTNDGALWWNATNKSFYGDGSGYNVAPNYYNYNYNGVAGQDPNTSSLYWYKYVYLFPNGNATGARINTDSTYDHYAVPPLPQYAYLRSSAYNPLYYDPTVTYTFWAPAYYSGAAHTFANATKTAAPSHPALGSVTFDVTAVWNSAKAGSNWTANNYTFRMQPGMVIPWSTVSGMSARCTSTASGCKAKNVVAGNWVTNNPVANNADYTIATGEYWDVAIPFTPATYYAIDSTCTTPSAVCIKAPDNRYLKPVVLTTAADLQNFANWFAYYRKRKLMLAAASGAAFTSLKGIRGGSVYFNSLSSVTMYDFGGTNNAANIQTILGAIYINPAGSGTPTRAALKYIGDQFNTNTNVIQYACQRNSAFIITDGFAETTAATVPSYTAATYESSAPYTTTYAGSLADIASAYYTNTLRGNAFTAGLVPIDPTDASANPDLNPNLHMNTYALTLGAKGTIFGTSQPTATNPFLNYPFWPQPNVSRNPSAVDDLWHATLNGRGGMYTASDPTNLTTALRQSVVAMLARSGTDASAAVSNVNIRVDNNTIYVSTFEGQTWSGELAAYPVDTNTGAVTISPATQIWAARAQLTARTPANRYIATYDNTNLVGIPFQAASLPTSYRALLNTPGTTDYADVVAYLRGDRSNEGDAYRLRSALLGDAVDAKPTVVTGPIATYADTGYAAFASSIANRAITIYQATNDGMLHAFDGTNGAELWAYVPSLVLGRLNRTGTGASELDYYASPYYLHQYTVDGTPIAADVSINGTWKTILVAGLRGGGKGYYALDTTTPAAANEAAVVNKVLWEFPNATTPASYTNNMGFSFGKPIVAKTRAAGWVVLVTSGYNNTTGDGQGHLFVLDAATGSVVKDIPTGVGSNTSPSGLAQLSATAASQLTDATIDYVYGGDLNGNVWRFDLSGQTVASWPSAPTRLATLVDSSTTVQPITTAPEITTVQGKRLIIVGTGSFLGVTDVNNTQTQSLYALVDNLTPTPLISNVRGTGILYKKTVSVGTGNLRNIPSDYVDLGTYKGWYFDLSVAGERINEDPIVAFGAVVIVTNKPSLVACNALSFIYALDANNGGQLPSAGFLPNETHWTGKQLDTAFATQPVIAALANGNVVALTHASDASVVTTRLPLSSVSKVTKVSVREVTR